MDRKPQTWLDQPLRGYTGLSFVPLLYVVLCWLHPQAGPLPPPLTATVTAWMGPSVAQCWLLTVHMTHHCDWRGGRLLVTCGY